MTSSTNISPERRDRTAIPSRGFSLPGSRVGVLLIHGFAGSIADLRMFGERLRQQYGYSVLGVRLAGHGSTASDLARSTVEDWIASARAGLHQLAATTDHIIIIGESMGSLIGIRLARESSKVTGLVLLAPAFKVAHQRPRQIISAVTPPEVRMRKTWVDDARAERGSLKEVTVGAYSQLMRLVRDPHTAPASITLPTLMMFAEGDSIGDPSYLSSLSLPGSIEVERVAASAHHLNESQEFDRLVERMHTFIAAHV